MKKTFVILLASFIYCGVNAQVTIGSTIKPNAGALLDLKMDDKKKRTLPKDYYFRA